MFARREEESGWGSVACVVGGLAVVVVFLAVLTFNAGWSSGAACEQKKAKDAGVGRWVVNQSTGATEFKYGFNN